MQYRIVAGCLPTAAEHGYYRPCGYSVRLICLQAADFSYGLRMRTRVKICGITRPGDALAAVAAGADAIGLVFYEPSPRHVTQALACDIARQVAPFVSIVGLFVNALPATVQATIEQVPLSLLQFHGQESNADCRQFGMPFIKSVAMRADTDLAAVARDYPDAAGLLLDTWQPETHGGGGVAFDWQYIRGHVPVPLILAGGLSEDLSLIHISEPTRPTT